jgi:group I intron endonuclease
VSTFKEVLPCDRKALIYLITNVKTGKSYIGKTLTTLNSRWRAHVRCAKFQQNNMLIARSIGQHGEEYFERSILEECTEKNYSEKETYWIKLLKTHVSEGGYNLTYGGDGGLTGYKFSDESKNLIRIKAIGRKHTEETKLKMRISAKSRTVSAETIALRASVNRGKKRSKEQIERIKAGQIAANYKHSLQAKIKISIASKNRITSEETKEKLRKSSTGKKHTSEAKKRISTARSKAVFQMTLDGNFIEMFSSIRKASIMTKIGYCTIQRSIYAQRPGRGFCWKFVESSENI